jgi:hypothetical protein
MGSSGFKGGAGQGQGAMAVGIGLDGYTNVPFGAYTPPYSGQITFKSIKMYNNAGRSHNLL